MEKRKKKKLLPILIILALLLLLGFCAAPSEDSTLDTSVESTSEPSAEPTPEPSPEPSVEPSAEPDPEPEKEPELQFTSDTLQVHRNEVVTVTVQGKPNTEYRISVTYHSGHVSEASGLGLAMSDENGVVSWTWKVGGKTGFGSSYFTVTGGGTSARYDFEVVDD